VQFARHFDHRPAEPHARKEPLRRLVPLSGRKHHAWHAARPKELKRGVNEQPADASTAMLRGDDDVVQDSRWPAQRHVVVTLYGGVCVADHSSVVIGDEDCLIRVFELRAYEGRIARRCLWPRGQEALRVEVVMLLDKQRAEAANQGQVGRRRAPDDRHGLGVSWHHTRLTFASRINSQPVSARVQCSVLPSEYLEDLVSLIAFFYPKHFDEPLKIENIARELGMSVSGFHHLFKSV